MAPGDRKRRSGPAVSPEADIDAEDETRVSSASSPNSGQTPSDKEGGASAHFAVEEEPEGPEEAPESEDHEAQLEHDLEELTAKAEKADEYLELAQRTRA